ncbi:amidohydrolase family protein [Microbacterium kitamiense]|uniref:Amidohydrolase family protein n=1 Tax=Microbacterium aurantiacum TaxID=162393 RepID=A0AAJ2LX75_9MICO|nr:amidohydrolase family protein [Microbacterium aurantiacum]
MPRAPGSSLGFLHARRAARVPVNVLVRDVRLVDHDEVVEDAWVRFADGRVTATGRGTPRDPGPGVRVVDGDGGVLTPGFIDIHGHGGGGAAYDDGRTAAARARAFHRGHGTTRAVLSLVTAPLPRLVERVATVADLAASDETILGSHLEGPFLDPGHHGAHDPALLRLPSRADIDRLLVAGRGTIRQVTLAPELPGAEAALAQFRAAGVVVAVGHTDADAVTAARAFDAGARILTHAFNAMRGIHHRHPGPVVAALRDDRVVLEVIADGVHVHPDVVALLVTAAPGRIALVTDATAAAGTGDGPSALGSLAIEVREGVARVRGTDTIAGSTLTQDAALRRAVAAGVPLPAVVTALTSTPARAIGRPDLGHLDAGSPADAVLLDSDLRVRRVWIAGVEERPDDSGIGDGTAP